MNPKISNTSSGSSMDQSIKQYDNQESSDLYDLQLALGKIPVKKQDGGGRTLNVPKYLPDNVIPGSSFNSGHTIGRECVGPHCGVPIKPTAYNYMTTISKLPESPPGVVSQIPGGYRQGNSDSMMLYPNQNGGTPFSDIIDPFTLKKYPIKSHKGDKILKRYLSRIKNLN